jgi:hypothetical protein
MTKQVCTAWDEMMGPMPLRSSIQQAPRREVVARTGPRLSADDQQRLIGLLAIGLERWLARAREGEPSLNSGAPGAIYGRHPTNEVTCG